MHCHHAGRDALANERGGSVVQVAANFLQTHHAVLSENH
jgi:hypothetical protein